MSRGPKQVALIQDPKPRGLVVNQNQSAWKQDGRPRGVSMMEQDSSEDKLPLPEDLGMALPKCIIRGGVRSRSKEALISPESRSVIEK